jgi:hypothetical protein
VPAPPLEWKEDQGYDVHLLRGGTESRRLVDDLDLGPGQAASVTFVPNLQGSTSEHGIEVDATAGVVKALPHPDPSFPKVNNFLLTAVFPDPDGAQDQTVIRIHVHDSVKDIWLSPPTLTVRQGTNECQFTVLARFTDDTVADITDWQGLSFNSDNEAAVTVAASGVLTAVTTSGSASITATLSGAPNPSPPVTANAGVSWADLAKAATVSFVAGRVAPDMADADNSQPDSVQSVVAAATNVLFISDGFQNDQRFDYRNIVNTIARVMRGDEGAYATAFQPFGLLKNSFNFWTVFIPSQQDGVTVLGEFFDVTLSQLIGSSVIPPTQPASDAAIWSFREFMYEVGLPIPADATRTLPELLADWQQLFGPHVTEARVADLFKTSWNVMPFHSLLNERDTAFGMTISDLPRASDIYPRNAATMVLSARRTSVASFQEFVSNLTVSGFPIGDQWKTGGPDASFVGFLCLSDMEAGTEQGTRGFFTVSTGRNVRHVNLKKAADSGLEIETGPVISTHRHLMASNFAHEFGHALGLADEYGDGAGTSLSNGSDTEPGAINAQAKVVIAPAASSPPAYDSSKISWLYPRITAAGVVSRDLADTDITSAGIVVPLIVAYSAQFAVNDIVRFWARPVLLAASFDLFVHDFFRVSAVAADSVTILPVTVTAGSNATTDVDMSTFAHDLFLAHFSAGTSYSVIRPLRVAGDEIKLVAAPILKHINDSNGPLNAPPGTPTAACVAASSSSSNMTPTNLPALSRMPRTKADIVGIYEGGAYHDCGVFRPAGRCRMRENNVDTNVFCHVCRYTIVDAINPAAHGDLDKLYPEVSV